MKQYLPSVLRTLLLLMLLSTACKKTTDNPLTGNSSNTAPAPHDTSLTAVNTTVHPYPVTPTQECVYSPNYGDSIVYAQSAGSSIIYPQNTQGIEGTYLSWPGGLAIDSVTGAINLSQSQAGARYDIAFVQYGTRDTCISQLIVAGSDYVDSIYVLNQNTVTASPYFNANASGTSPCDTKNNNHGNDGSTCQFDYTKTAKKQGVEIDNQTGVIDLQKTSKNIFGKNPYNGSVAYSTINYKLNDASNNAPQQLGLLFVYFNRKSDIPAPVLSLINSRRAAALTNQLVSKGPSPRPPLIIIVRSN